MSQPARAASAPPDRHIFIFWNTRQTTPAQLLEEVGANFEINEVAWIHWTCDRIVENFRHFYVMTAEAAKVKRLEVAEPKFLFAAVTDRTPEYRYHRFDNTGFRKLNIATFRLKQRLRNVLKVSVHGTENAYEFRRDYQLLLGATPSRDRVVPWNGDTHEIRRDVVGIDGWADFDAVFASLGSAFDYALVRPFAPNLDFSTAERIALLFERGSTAQQAAALLGLSSAGTVPIGGREVRIELRAADDFHIDPNWAREIMASRVWAGPVCRIDAENLFFLSAYELRLSEGPIAQPKAELLAELALRACISDATVDDFLDDARLAHLLTDWFQGKEYHLTYPGTDSAFDSGFAAQIIAPFLLPSRSNLYRDLKSNGLDQRNLIERYVQFEKNFMSRAFLFRMLMKRTFGL